MLLGPLSLVVGMSWAEGRQGVPFGTGTLTPWLLTGERLEGTALQGPTGMQGPYQVLEG